MDEKYSELCKQLSCLGFSQTFPLDSMELVESLLADLIQTTRSLRYYMNLSKEVLQQRDSLRSATEPYKCDNAKLIKENNKLHMNLLHCKEDLMYKIKESRLKMKELEDKISELNDLNKNLKLECQEHRLKSISGKTISSANKSISVNKVLTSKSDSVSSSTKTCSTCLEVKKQVDRQSREYVNLVDKITFLQTQLATREKEIQRLNMLLEGGRPISVLKREYCTEHQDSNIKEIMTKLNQKEVENLNLHEQLTDSLAKQHEAMRKAVKLADQNKVLENEIQSTDEMALKLEAECNARLSEKQSIISALKNKLQSLNTEENMDTHRECLYKLESKISENNAIKSTLNSLTDYKDKLDAENKELLGVNKKLEETILNLRECYEHNSLFHRNSKNRSQEPSGVENIPKDFSKLLEKERQFYESHLNDIKEKLNYQKEIYNLSVKKEQYDKIRDERDFYFKLYNNLKDSTPREEYVKDLQNKLCHLEQQIVHLQKQNTTTVEKNDSLQSQLDELSHRKKNESYIESERLRMLDKDMFNTYEEMRCRQVDKKLEQISELRQECSNLRENLKISDAELLHMKTLYNQLKSLQFNNDKGISDAQAQLFETKKELGILKSTLTNIQQQKSELEYELKLLKTDKTALKDNLSQIDQERDKLVMDVDEKTEKIFSLQHQLRSKDTSIELLENKVTELTRKLDLVGSENSVLEHKLHDVQTCGDAMSQELDMITKQRDNALIENRRLQSDTAALTNDIRSIKREYENSRKEVDEMKQQLQHYVDEVRRIEDILSRKEAERTEMLDHFASLSQEATILETNNHSLENESASKNIQLQSATGKLVELESKLKSRESLIEMQEEKITALALKISALETERLRFEHMLTNEQEMCKMLDNQKKTILIGVGETENERKTLEYNFKILNNDKKKLEDILAKNKGTIDSLEILLADCRRENVELKLSHQNTSDENQKLMRKVDNLLKRLGDIENESLSSRQRTEEAAKQLQELQHQMSDQRYQRVQTTNFKQKSSKFYETGTL